MLQECGVDPSVERWRNPKRGAFDTLDDLVAATRRRLCLTSDHDAELGDILRGIAVRSDQGWMLGDPEVDLVTFWWEASG